MISSVYVISEEKVVEALNVPILRWWTPQVKESHQILVLTVNISENLYWGLYLKDHRLFLEYFLAFFSESNDVLSTECKIAVAVKLGGPLSGPEEDVQEELVQSVHWVHCPVLSCCSTTQCYLWCIFSLLIIHERQSDYLRTLTIAEINLRLRNLDLGIIQLASKRGSLRAAAGLTASFGAAIGGSTACTSLSRRAHKLFEFGKHHLVSLEYGREI